MLSNKEKIVNYINSAIRMNHKELCIVFKNKQGNSMNIIDANLFAGCINDIEDLFDDDLKSIHGYDLSIIDYVSGNNFELIKGMLEKYLN